MSYHLKSYIANGIDIPDKMKEVHKIYAPKAYDFLVNHARSQKMTIHAKGRKHKRYISDVNSESNKLIFSGSNQIGSYLDENKNCRSLRQNSCMHRDSNKNFLFDSYVQDRQIDENMEEEDLASPTPKPQRHIPYQKRDIQRLDYSDKSHDGLQLNLQRTSKHENDNIL